MLSVPGVQCCWRDGCAKKIIIIQCDKVPWGRNMLGAMQLQGGHEQESWKGNVLVRLLREGA